jgi:predicted membrane-bound mannosyltransferase/sugar lactone lactonase YvrE
MSDEKPTTLPHGEPETNRPGLAWLDKAPIASLPWLTLEVLIFAGIILLAIVSRFYDLGTRVMSHDESLHTYYSWTFSRGQGYQHNPMMHGPLQFHLIALSYFIFGASDFTARIPAAVFSILAVVAVWYWRRYLGRTGMLVAATLALISPFLLYYGRYTREDPYVGVSFFIMLYSILRYFETGRAKYIYLITGALAIHFLTKETSFIYAAQALVYLAVYFIIRVTKERWQNNEADYRAFVVSLILGGVLIAAALAATKIDGLPGTLDAAETLSPAIPADAPHPLAPPISSSPLLYILGSLGVLALGTSVFFLFRGYGWERIRQERSFDLLILIGTLVLPMLAAFPMKILSDMGVGVAIPTGDQELNSFLSGELAWMGGILALFIALAVLIGYFWNKDVWWKAMLLFYSIYILFYTSFFTNGAGFFTGIVGSLGYWLGQQGVARGSQPFYYYFLIQIPIYEFLPAIASLLALYFTLRLARNLKNAGPEEQQELENQINVSSLLGWWTFTSIIAFTLAGEKMPWLTLHMALPMVLWGGWAIGKVIDGIDWADLRERKALLVVALLAVFTTGILVVFISFLGEPRPFAGNEIPQLQATSTFVLSIIGVAVSAWALYVLLKGWSIRQFVSLTALVFFGILAVLTVRTSIRANYILYDAGMEYLVYAHGFTGVKDVLQEVIDLSNKTTGEDYAIVVAYDDDTSWPLSWYMRDFKNAKFYGGSPGVDLRDVPAIIVGDNNFSKIEPIVDGRYYRYDYIRMIWPNQDYFNLSSEREASEPFPQDYACSGVFSVFQLIRGQDFSRLCSALSNPQMRQAIFDIWLNRDYTLYAQVTGSQGLTLHNWDPADRMRLYVRKDVGQLVWKYGAAPVPVEPNPWEELTITLNADLVVGSGPGADPGQFNGPRGIAFAPDGTFYVADSRNHRIQHFGADGQVINTWGTFGDVGVGEAGGGLLNEPWGVAVGPDGSVYVADTWNHRIQKFDANGNFIKMWGAGTAGSPTVDNPSVFYGPRGISVDANNRVYLADTGNKRIVIFDSNGTFLSQFGSEGFEVGKFSEPVDVKVDSQGNVYVTDTWNQRVQVFSPDTDRVNFIPLRQWPISGWKSQSLDNKPYIALSPNGHVFVTDPEGFRVFEFTSEGENVQTWGTFGTDNASFGLSSGIAVDSVGQVWVSDAGNNRVLRFNVPSR